MPRCLPILVVAAASAVAPSASSAALGASDDDGAAARQNPRYMTCMLAGAGCGHRVEEGDIPYARFKDRRGQRPRVRTCVRDRDGRYCLRRDRPGANGRLLQPVLYRNTGRHKTTWRVNGKIVGRWRWRVKPK